MSTAVSPQLDISKAKKCHGWMSECDLYWLADMASHHQRIVELGSFLGRSTRALGEHAQGVVAAVDDFWGPRELMMDMALRQSIYPTFKDNCGDLVDSGKIKVFKMRHDEKTADFVCSTIGRPDMVFIDGDHLHQSVIRDVMIWKERLEFGGLLCGHDATYNEVQMALEKTLKHWETASCDIWTWVKPPPGATYGK